MTSVFTTPDSSGATLLAPNHTKSAGTTLSNQSLLNKPGTNATTFDDDYLERLRSGDNDTAEHFNRHFRRLLNSILWRRLSFDRLQDLIADIMTVALQNILRGDLREASHLPAYVRGIGFNLLKKELKKPSIAEIGSLNVEWLSDNGQTPEEKLLAAERAQLVAEVLATLSPRDCNLLTDIFYHELDRDEVCEKYGVTGNQLRLVLFRARVRFQKKWPKKS